MVQLRTVAILSALVLTGGCTSDPESAFIQGRTLDECTEDIPVCSTVADCILNTSNYISATFAGGPARNYIVTTQGAAEISLDLFFENETSPGSDTEITWYEASCSSSATWQSDGADLFNAAGPARVWSTTHQFTTGGDHLIQVVSDIQASYLLRIDILQGS